VLDYALPGGLRILDEIRNYLRRYGVRKLSEALRLACRTIAFNEKLLTTYETMRFDDDRRKDSNPNLKMLLLIISPFSL
jgi:hypothetical protein